MNGDWMVGYNLVTYWDNLSVWIRFLIPFGYGEWNHTCLETRNNSIHILEIQCLEIRNTRVQFGDLMWFIGDLVWFIGDLMGFYRIYPLVYKHLHSELESHHAMNGTALYFDWAIFNSNVTNYQRVMESLLFRDKQS